MAADPTSPPYWLLRAEREKPVILYSCDRCGTIHKSLSDMRRIELVLIKATGGEGGAHVEKSVMWCKTCVTNNLSTVLYHLKGS